MLIKSNESLVKLYTLLGKGQKEIDQLNKWQELSIHNFNHKLYNKALGAYVHYDLRNDRQLQYICSSSFAPLYSPAPNKDIAESLVRTMLEKFGGEDRYLCASFDPGHEKFNPKKYWRGPVWINMNWIIHHGLKKQGFEALASQVKEDSLELITQHGFFEYFDARKANPDAAHSGYGGNNFSWSAALLIDFLNQDAS